MFEACSNLGIALQALKQLDAAIASYDKAIALKPDLAEACSNRGLALQELKQLDAAVASFDQAIALKPDYAEAYYNRGIALERTPSNLLLCCELRQQPLRFRTDRPMPRPI